MAGLKNPIGDPQYYVKNISCDRMSYTECVGLVNLVDSLDHIYDNML